MCLMKKLCLLIATLITGMIGVGMIILGRKKMNEVVFLDAFLEDHIHIGRTFISLGFVLFVIASIGLVGLICHVSLLLQIYACLMLAMVVTQIVVGVAVFSRMESIKQALYKTLEEKFRTYDEHKAEIDKLQSVLLCCGMSGPKEWKIKELPPSCCGQTSGSCSVKSAYTASCSVRAKQTVKIGIYFVGILFLILVLFETKCVILACCLSDLCALCSLCAGWGTPPEKPQPEKPQPVTKTPSPSSTDSKDSTSSEENEEKENEVARSESKHKK